MEQTPNDVTLATYEAGAKQYRNEERQKPPRTEVESFLVRFAQLVPNGRILELGSGTGRDAKHLEGLGLHVVRTDATSAFVRMLTEDGHDARLLNVRRDDLGGPYDAILAMATFLHLSRPDLATVLSKARSAVREAGLLAFTLKEGDGEGWSTAKLDRPRHFVYWREAPIRAALHASGWKVLSLDYVMGHVEPWLQIIAGRPQAT